MRTGTERPTLADVQSELARFLACVFAPDDVVEVRRIWPERGPDKPKPISSWHRASELAAQATALIADNGRGFGVYVGANPRKAKGGTKAADVALARCLFADFDGGTTPDEALGRIDAAGLPRPTLIVASGHGTHAFWRLAEPLSDLASWTGWQKDLIALLGSDDSIHDAPRVMRLPGFTNTKEPPAPAYIVEADPSRVYELADLPIPPRPDHKTTASTPTPNAKPSNPLGVLARAASYLAEIPGAIQGQGGDDHTYKTACKLVIDFGLSIDEAMPLFQAWNRTCSPPWTDADLRAKLEGAAKYGTGTPGTKANAPPPTKAATPTAQTQGPPPTDSVPDPPTPGWWTIGEIGAMPNYSAGLPPITTGYTVLDEALGGGFRPECVYVLAGRTGSAKTTLAAANIVRRVALAGHCVLLFKLEEKPKETTWRIHAAAAQVPFKRLLDGARGADAAEQAKLADAWDLIRTLPIRVTDTRRIEAIERIAENHAKDGGKLVVIDQLSQVIVPDADVGYPQATIASNTLRALAADLGLAVLIVCQVNRPSARDDEKRLTCHTLRDSGAIENDAAAVLLIDGVRKADGPRWHSDPLTLEIVIGKNRYGTTTGPNDKPLELHWWPWCCRIEDARTRVCEGAA